MITFFLVYWILKKKAFILYSNYNFLLRHLRVLPSRRSSETRLLRLREQFDLLQRFVVSLHLMLPGAGESLYYRNSIQSNWQNHSAFRLHLAKDFLPKSKYPSWNLPCTFLFFYFCLKCLFHDEFPLLSCACLPLFGLLPIKLLFLFSLFYATPSIIINKL